MIFIFYLALVVYIALLPFPIEYMAGYEKSPMNFNTVILYFIGLTIVFVNLMLIARGE